MYRPIAARGAAIYFVLRQLLSLNHMYQFSLGVFLSLFKRALAADAPNGGDITARIATLSDALLELVGGVGFYVSEPALGPQQHTCMAVTHHLVAKIAAI